MASDHAELVARIEAREAGFRHARQMFLEALSLVVGEAEGGLPGSFDMIPGDRDALSRLGSRVEDLAHAYDGLQAAMGLRADERTRFASFFTGRPGVCVDPPPWHRGEPDG